MTTDALRLEIFRHALTGITDEMSVTLRRAAYSTNIKTRLDFSCALLDGQARMAAQSFAQPIHLGTLWIRARGGPRCGPCRRRRAA